MYFIYFEYLIRFVASDPHGGMSCICFEYLIRFVASDPHGGMPFICFEYLIRFVAFDPHGGVSCICFEYLIRFVASDPLGGVSPIHEVSVVLCGKCSDQGSCNLTDVKMDEDVAPFGRASCICELGYDGLFYY